jgi:hypothetical protein
MKKKYLKYFAFLMLPLLSTGLFINDVNAEEVCRGKVSLSRIKQLKVESLFNGGSHTYWSISVDGMTALCLDHTKHLNSGDLVMQDACSIPDNRSKQALNYCSSSGCSDSISRIVAQTYTWGGSEEAAAEAVCSFKGIKNNTLQRDICKKEQMTSGGGTAVDIYRAIASSSSAGDFTCWQNGNKQPVVTKTPIECKEFKCPPDTVEAGKDLTQCVTGGKTYEQCVEEECGEEAACHGIQITLNGELQPCVDNNSITTSTFNEYFGAEDINAHDSMNGRKQDVNIGSGKYCSLYCLETEADANLPGGLANPIHLGSAITWPTSPKTNTSKFGNRFPLYYHGQMKCRLQVAPNLTYGNSCELYPEDEYADFRKKLKESYEDNTKAKKKVDDANNRRTGHNSNNVPGVVDLTKIPNGNAKPYIYLDWTNENIRKKEIKTYQELIKAALANNGKGPDFFEDLRKTAADNETKAKSNYEKIWKKYQEDNRKEPEYSCTNSGVYDKDTGSCSTGSKTPSCPADEDGVSMSYNSSVQKCEYGEVDIREKKDTDNSGWWYDTIEYWKGAKNALNDKNNKYNTYIKRLKKTIDLYNEIYLCATVVPEIFGKTCNGPECQFYNFLTSAEMSYTDEGDEYGTSYTLDMEQPANYSCPGCSTPVEMWKPDEVLQKDDLGGGWIIESKGQTYFNERIDLIEDKKFDIDSGDVIYKLPDGLYNYINKDTMKWEMTLPSGSNYVTHGLSKNGEFLFSNLPTSFKNKVGKKYDLKVENIQLGHNGQFVAGAEGVSMDNPYICHYTVTSDTNKPCTCPPGTKYAGMMLTQIIADENLTCAEAQFEYCDRDSPPPECEENCEYFCESDPTIEITACVNEGRTKAWCEAKLCPPGGNDPRHYCPNDSVKNKGMEITSCVIARVSKGATLSEAKKYCEDRLCNLDQLIIYRTIDLKNPFPSIDADETALADWPDVGVFNLAIHGRYPGSNWNSQKLVQSRIHTVKRGDRKVENNDIYKEKKPLYHFELDTAAIKKIRKYNNKQKDQGGYNDNQTLICNRTVGDDLLGAGCVSQFLHGDNSEQYGADTTGAKSLCGNAKTSTAVAKCLGVMHG